MKERRLKSQGRTSQNSFVSGKLMQNKSVILMTQRRRSERIENEGHNMTVVDMNQDDVCNSISHDVDAVLLRVWSFYEFVALESLCPSYHFEISFLSFIQEITKILLLTRRSFIVLKNEKFSCRRTSHTIANYN